MFLFHPERKPFGSDRKAFCFVMFPLSSVSCITITMLMGRHYAKKFLFYFGGVTAAGLSLGRPLRDSLYTASRSTDKGELIADWWIFAPDCRMS